MSASALVSMATSLRWRILLPLIVGLILLVAIFATAIFGVERAQLKDSLEHNLDMIAAWQKASMALRGNKLAAAGELLARDPDLRQALAARDRQRLLKHAEPMFNGMKHDFNITHFYFHDAQRRVLLRLHNPASFGDRIERFTAREAERTGRTAVGVELGKTGTYTLRAVVPVREAGRTIGYIELGEEVLDSLLELGKAFKGVEAYVLLYKTGLARKDWEQFMRMLGRTPDWEHYPNMVLAATTQSEAPAFMDALFSKSNPGAAQQKDTTLKSGGKTYNVGNLPLTDAAGREVGRLLVLRDVTDISDQTRRELLGVIFTAILGGTVLSVFFFFHLRHTERELDIAHKRLTRSHAAREATQRRHIEELSGRINDLERFERLTVGRELRIQALREENRRLRGALDMETGVSPKSEARDEHGG